MNGRSMKHSNDFNFMCRTQSAEVWLSIWNGDETM